MTTRVIQEYPGYYWQLEDNQWYMMWEPVHGWYSPPCLHPDIKKYELSVPRDLQDKIGLIIGREGHNFIRITEQTGCEYIFYLSIPNKIEIWGSQDSVHAASCKIRHLFYKIRNYNNTVVV